jgi:uncharacterized protein YuzE
METLSKLKKEIFSSLIHIQKIGANQVYYDLDEEADVMYISFRKPQNATKTTPDDDGNLFRYDSDGNIVGITIMNYKKLFKSK